MGVDGSLVNGWRPSAQPQPNSQTAPRNPKKEAPKASGSNGAASHQASDVVVRAPRGNLFSRQVGFGAPAGSAFTPVRFDGEGPTIGPRPDAIAGGGVFSAHGSRVNPRSYTGRPENATATEAAADVLTFDQPGQEQAQTDRFLEFLEAHSGDAEWTREFLNNLGADASAMLMSRAVSPLHHQYSTPELADRAVTLVRGAVSALGETATQADMDALMAHWAGDVDSQGQAPGIFTGGAFNQGLTLVFAHESVPLAVRNLFFNSAASASRNTALSEQIRNGAAAAALSVLGTTDSSNVAAMLLAQGSPDVAAALVERAMANGSEIFYLASLSPYGVSTGGEFHAPLLLSLNLGVSNVITLLGQFRGGDAAADEAVASLRSEIFTAAVGAMERNPIWATDGRFKDALSVVFMRDFDRIWRQGLTENGARLTPALGHTVEIFLQHALFSEPPGALRDALSGFVANTLRQWSDDIRTLTEAEVLATYGIDKSQLAFLAGDILGRANNAMERALGAANANAQTQERVLSTVLDLVFAFLPGRALITGRLGQEGATFLNTVLDDLSDLGETSLRDLTVAEARQMLEARPPGFVADLSLSALATEISGLLPATTGNNFLTPFAAGFSFADGEYSSAS